MAAITKTSVQLAKQYLHYKAHPLQFIEDCIMIPTPGGDQHISLYDPQKRVIQDFLDHHFVILLKTRQTGFSTLFQCVAAYISTFFQNCVMGIISRDGPEASDFCRKTEDMIDKLPDWIRPAYKSKSVQSYILESGTQLWSSTISPANPGAVFRGKSLVLLIMDEAAHIRYIDQAWTGIAPSLSKAQQSARQKGIPYGTAILSTPNRTQGVGKFFFQTWSEASSGKHSIFRPSKIHWTEIPAFVDDPNWYQQQCGLLNNDKSKIAQELELKFVSTDDSLFAEQIQSALQAARPKPLEKIRVLTEYEIWRFKDIDPKKYHLVGIDTASNAGKDFSAIQVVEYETMDQVLEFKGKLPVKKFVEVIDLVARMIPNNLLIIESNSYGNQVVEELTYNEDRHYNLYGEWKGPDKKNFVEGLGTTARTRPLILDAMFTYVNDNPEIIRSERLALELLSLVGKKNRVEADAGCNDDLAMAYGFICYARHYSKDVMGNAESMDGEVASTELESIVPSLMGANNERPSLWGAARGFGETLDFKQIKMRAEEFLKDPRNLVPNKSGVVNTLDLWKDSNGSSLFIRND